MSEARTGIGLTAFAQVAQPSRNLARSVAFYRDILGATHISTVDPPGLAFFDIAGVRLMLDAIPGAIDHPGAPLYFRVEDLDAAVAALHEANVTVDQEPELVARDEEGLYGQPGGEEWMAFFRDPDGNILAFAEARLPDAS